VAAFLLKTQKKMFNAVYKNTEKIRAVVSSTSGTKFLFDKNQILDNKPVAWYGLQLATAAQLSKDVDGKTVIADAVSDQFLITLVDNNNREVIKDVPIRNFLTSANSGFTQLINNFEINLSKSYITMVDNTSVSANTVVIFTVLFDYI